MYSIRLTKNNDDFDISFAEALMLGCNQAECRNCGHINHVPFNGSDEPDYCALCGDIIHITGFSR